MEKLLEPSLPCGHGRYALARIEFNKKEIITVANKCNSSDLSPVLFAAEHWIKDCLISDRSVFFPDKPRWTAALVDEVHKAFVLHPDLSHEDFMTKLKNQMAKASPSAQQLTSETLWALLLFPSNMKPRTKRQQICEIFALSGSQLPTDHPMLADPVLKGIGSGGPGFNNYRPDELTFLIEVTRDLKARNESDREVLFHNYDAFFDWINSVRRKGSRQFRHMLRYFSFPDRVERISSNNDRREILKRFGIAPARGIGTLSDKRLDEQLLALRTKLQAADPSAVLDFYEPPLKERWARDGKVKTPEGEVTVSVPVDEDEIEDETSSEVETKPVEIRQSIQIQSKLAMIGITMGFKIWIPRSDRNRVMELLSEGERTKLLESLPLNNDMNKQRLNSTMTKLSRKSDTAAAILLALSFGQCCDGSHGLLEEVHSRAAEDPDRRRHPHMIADFD